MVVIHDIVENGVVCGTIVYDSKNRNAWQNNFAVKLRSDMIAAEADHAILSTNKFPAGSGKQLHLHEGVILACPARVVALAQMLREHIVQTHGLRMSAEQREEKTAALYDYVTSERCNQLMGSLQSSFEKLDKLRVILRDPVARDHFLSDGGDLDSAALRVSHPGPIRGKAGLTKELEAAVAAMKAVPWTTISELRGDAETLAKIEEAENLLRTLKRSLT